MRSKKIEYGNRRPLSMVKRSFAQIGLPQEENTNSLNLTFFHFNLNFLITYIVNLFFFNIFMLRSHSQNQRAPLYKFTCLYTKLVFLIYICFIIINLFFGFCFKLYSLISFFQKKKIIINDNHNF
jgi:hypothetical protein